MPGLFPLIQDPLLEEVKQEVDSQAKTKYFVTLGMITIGTATLGYFAYEQATKGNFQTLAEHQHNIHANLPRYLDEAPLLMLHANNQGVPNGNCSFFASPNGEVFLTCLGHVLDGDGALIAPGRPTNIPLRDLGTANSQTIQAIAKKLRLLARIKSYILGYQPTENDLIPGTIIQDNLVTFPVPPQFIEVFAKCFNLTSQQFIERAQKTRFNTPPGRFTVLVMSTDGSTRYFDAGPDTGLETNGDFLEGNSYPLQTGNSGGSVVNGSGYWSGGLAGQIPVSDTAVKMMVAPRAP